MAVNPNALKLSPEAVNLINAGGVELLRELGADAVRDVVYGVMVGKNLRDSTEALTRRKLLVLNAAIVQCFVNGVHSNSNFLDEIAQTAANMLAKKHLPKHQKWLLNWILGLTEKQVQNVLRDDQSALEEYTLTYARLMSSSVRESVEHYGEASGEINIGGVKAPLDWRFLSYLFTVIGSSTLTVRGSDKSTAGKLFEHLILGSLLTVLGFRMVKKGEPEDGKMVFWLSEQGEKRESDATCLFQKGVGVRFDIGFIGRGNTEITLDKVTRFENDPIIAGNRASTRTIIIVDRLGEKSNVAELARKIGGAVVQMSMQHWPRQVAIELRQSFPSFDHRLLHLDDADLGKWLRQELDTIDILSFASQL